MAYRFLGLSAGLLQGQMSFQLVLSGRGPRTDDATAHSSERHSHLRDDVNTWLSDQDETAYPVTHSLGGFLRLPKYQPYLWYQRKSLVAYGNGGPVGCGGLWHYLAHPPLRLDMESATYYLDLLLASCLDLVFEPPRKRKKQQSQRMAREHHHLGTGLIDFSTGISSRTIQPRLLLHDQRGIGQCSSP